MTGIYLCYLAGLLTIIAAVLYFAPPIVVFGRTLHWGLPLILAVACIVVALLWGNIGVIYSHAGFSGYRHGL
jgi:hypothetical protein